MTCTELRKRVMKESKLPYSFSYKITRIFWRKPCPICNILMECKKYAGNNYIPTIQHNIPITKGGKHELGNISVICKRCNISIRNNVTENLNSDEVTKLWNEIQRGDLKWQK